METLETIPPALLDAVKEQRVVLFLGAGASLDAKNPNGTKMPQGDQLRDLICDKFLGGGLKEKPLSAVAAMAANEGGFPEFQRYIHDLFLPFQPADVHLQIPKFRWRAIATTNFDLLIEKAYSNGSPSLQELVKTVKDGDQFDVRLNKETDPVEFYKLHGCIDVYTDSEIPFVLGQEQYASYATNRTRLYNRLRDLAQDNPVVFVGCSLSDPHIQQILFDLTDPKVRRPPFYLVVPKFDDIEVRYWSSNRVFAIQATFNDFLLSLDRAVPPIARAIPSSVGGGELSIRKHYHVANPTEPASVVKYLATDAAHLYSGLLSSMQDPREFYRGYDDGWGCITQNLDVRRKISDAVLVDAVLLPDENRSPVELFMLKGPAGNGKSVSLKRIAWDTAVTYGQLALYVTDPAGLNIDPLTEIYRLTGKRMFLFVDHVALLRNELWNLLQSARSRSIPLSVFGAERDNEWNIYCEHLEPFVRHEFAVRYLNEHEIRQLLGLLETHNALGLLKDIPFEDRVQKFVDRAERQLLVALHETTLGVPFEDIVLDEFQRIEPETARNLYLDICALHRFGAPVRAGLISRASGIRFEDFQREFLQPLENVVRVIEDKHAHIIYYRSRHQHVAEMVFDRVLPDVQDKFNLLSRLLKAINVDYSSDQETFSRLIRGRTVAEIFSSAELGRRFYDHVEAAVASDSFVLHQRAVFEMQHPEGSLNQAETAATSAFKLNPTSRSIQHTQAEVARRLAGDTVDPLRRRALRQTAREKLGGNLSRYNEYDLYTHARLALDEFKDTEASRDEQNRGPSPAFVAAAKETETTIQRGIQMFPESPELLTVEASFREWLDENAKARETLERAFEMNPAQDWLAVRLSQKYQASGEVKKSKEVLESCLRDNPSSKTAHLEMGRILMGTDNNTALEHLRRSFTEGDNRYEAHFWYARELFLQHHFDEANRRFTTLHERAPGRFRLQSAAEVRREGALTIYSCHVQRKEEGYAFLRLDEFPTSVFASRADSRPGEWEQLNSGARAECALAFNRRGPRAIAVCLSGG